MPNIKRRYFNDIYKEIFVIYNNNTKESIVNKLIDYIYNNKKLLKTFESIQNIGFFSFKENHYYWYSKSRLIGPRYKHSIYIYEVDFEHVQNLEYSNLDKKLSSLGKYKTHSLYKKDIYFDKESLSYFPNYEFYKDISKLSNDPKIKEMLDGDINTFISFYKFSASVYKFYSLKTPNERLKRIGEFLNLEINISYDPLISDIIVDLSYLSLIRKYATLANNLILILLDKIQNNLYILSDTQIITYKDSFNKDITSKIYEYINGKVDIYSKIDSGGFIGLLDLQDFFTSKHYKQKKRKILIISEKWDSHVSKVLSFIDQEKYIVDILGIKDLENTGYINTFSNITGEFFDTEERKSRVYDICWWRKPNYIEKNNKYLKNINLSNMAEVEKRNFLIGTIMNIPIREWVNNILDMEKTNYKIHQLNIAQKNALSVPNTVITNKKEAIKKIFTDKFIMKSIRSQSFGLENGVLKTTLTTVSDIDKIDLNFSPVIVQEYIEKICDIRVTIIGDKVFTAKIFPLSEKAKVDFRTDYKNLRHEIFELPKDIEKKLLAINKYYHLNYSAIDLIEDKNGKIYFLEINPNGQYLWIEELLGLPVSENIAFFLKGKC